MIEICGGFLATFILGELRPVISRHPRFRSNDGSTLTAFSNLVMYKDVSLTVGNLRANGDQQSPDNYMATLLGRAVACKVNGSLGAFMEWVQETDRTRRTPAAGIYYLNIDAVNEETREVRAILEVNRWLSGFVQHGQGSRVYIDPRIGALNVKPQDPAISYRVGTDYLVILDYTPSLVLIDINTGQPLTPGLDWWVQVQQAVPLGVTTGGAQGGIAIPPGYEYVSIVDQDGYVLREDRDWSWTNTTTISLATWTPPGMTLSAVGSWRADPTTTSYIHPENTLTFNKAPDEVVVTGQGPLYTLMRGVFTDADVIWNSDGTATLKHLMDAGDTLRWEVRLRQPQVYIDFQKMARNSGMIPGLDIAVGDRVEVGDRAAVIVFPDFCETYEVYGAKDSVSFDITIKSNDLLTSTELGNLVKSYLLVEGRTRLESSGLTIQRCGTSYTGEARDQSGTAASHSVVINVTASADWEYHRPLVNRVTYIDLTNVQPVDAPPGKPLFFAKVAAFGLSNFITPYQ